MVCRDNRGNILIGASGVAIVYDALGHRYSAMIRRAGYVPVREVYDQIPYDIRMR